MSSELAERLWRARQDGRVIADADWPKTVAEGYAVQQRMVAHAAQPLAGWKIGATATAVQAMLSVDAPFIGPLFAAERYAGGATVPVAAAHTPGVECEFAVLIGQGLAAGQAGTGREQVRAAVTGICPAFEIVGTRLAAGMRSPGPRLIADGGANIAIIAGLVFETLELSELRATPVRLTKNGAPAAEGDLSGNVFADPIDAVVWLLAQPALAGRGLQPGDLVSTGTCTGITPIAAGDKITAHYGATVSISADFVDALPPTA